MQLVPDTIVSLRRCRWRIVSVRTFDGCELVTLRGASPFCAGTLRRVLSPFDRLEPIERCVSPRRVTGRRWRRACRAAIGADAPPGALRSPVDARIDLIPSQLAPALAIVRGHGCRVLLADEVGLGKTIQAGVILRELRARGAIARVLVLTPAGLRDQWRAELLERFDVDARIVDARAVRDASAVLPPDVNPWSTFEIVVASLDYVKRPDVLAGAAGRPWDLVVVDEAHGAASDSDRRAAVDALCTRATYVLLLTATPHSGDREAFAALCRLGQAGGDPLLVFRRTRREAGMAVRRRAHTLRVRPSRHERQLHRALRRYGDAVIAERPHAWLALSVLHKRALSSAAALAESVERRLAALTVGATSDAATQLALPLDAGENTPDEAPTWADELALSSVDRERSLLAALAQAARASSRRESKIGALVRLLDRVGEPVLVFTEYRDTLRHLQRAIRRPTIVLHGGLTRDERRSAVDRFTRAAGAVMLATDAAGEGLNLHASCRIVVNLELPWNPMRLEQRIGRVDRIGQTRTVHAIHLVARGTGETKLLARLRSRLADARSAVGAGDPFASSDERAAAEILVLRRSPTERSGDECDHADFAFPDLAGAARAEASRLATIRRVAHAAITDDPPQPLLMRARPSLRRRLRGRRLEIWRLAADDGCGRRAESQLVALSVDPGRLDVVDAALDPVAQEWQAAARTTVAAFTAARIRREIAVLEENDRSTPALDQVPLFTDRRRDRERLLTAAERRARLGDLVRRLDDARAAAVLVFRPPARLLIVVP